MPHLAQSLYSGRDRDLVWAWGLTPEPLPMADFFATPLADADPDLSAAIGGELDRQRDQIELIASENIVSRAVLEAQAGHRRGTRVCFTSRRMLPGLTRAGADTPMSRRRKLNRLLKLTHANSPRPLETGYTTAHHGQDSGYRRRRPAHPANARYR